MGPTPARPDPRAGTRVPASRIADRHAPDAHTHASRVTDTAKATFSTPQDRHGITGAEARSDVVERQGEFRLYGSLLDPARQLRIFQLDRVVVTEQFGLTGRHLAASCFPSVLAASLEFVGADNRARDLALPLWFCGDVTVEVDRVAFGLLAGADPHGPVPLALAGEVASRCDDALVEQLCRRVERTVRGLDEQLRSGWANWAVCRLDPNGLARSFLPWGAELERVMNVLPRLRLARAGEVRVVPLRAALSLSELCETRTLGVCSTPLPTASLLETGLQLWDDAGVFASIDAAMQAASRL